MAKMRTLVRHMANQKQMEPDEEYEADEQSAELAVALGFSERATQQIPATRVKRQYRRRDMRAES